MGADMTGDPDGFTRLFGPDDESLRARSRYYATSDLGVVATISCGVLFVMAWWSGPARQAFVQLKAALKRLDPAGQLELVVIDTDGVTGYVLPCGRSVLHGAGETFWIRDGVVIADASWGDYRQRVDEYTRRLMELCHSSHE
jgi:hypothetical protein